MSTTRASFLAAVTALALGGFALAGCSSGRIDPPRNGEGDEGSETEAVPGKSGGADSVAAWAQRARDGWANGDPQRADAASALARNAFTAAWAQAAEDRKDAQQAGTTERLPVVLKDAPPTPDAVKDALTKVGLAAAIVTADGHPALWQVVLSDPVGSASAATEFWAWPDTKSGGALPTLQSLPPRAPALRAFGPDAVGGLAVTSDGHVAHLASAWARPRGRGGLAVALAERKLDAQARWSVKASQALPLEVDSVAFAPAGGDGSAPPALLVTGAGARDPLFDDCPTCPHLDRAQRYEFAGGAYRLAEERVQPSPYAAFVQFMHALAEGTPDSALPYALDPGVIDEAVKLGLDRHVGTLRAVPGTTAQDVTQRFRMPDGQGIEVTLEPRGDHWVVGDVRAASITIE
jgi:hypothetical protein